MLFIAFFTLLPSFSHAGCLVLGLPGCPLIDCLDPRVERKNMMTRKLRKKMITRKLRKKMMTRELRQETMMEPRSTWTLRRGCWCCPDPLPHRAATLRTRVKSHLD